jgi:hypothetical protein
MADARAVTLEFLAQQQAKILAEIAGWKPLPRRLRPACAPTRP